MQQKFDSERPLVHYVRLLAKTASLKRELNKTYKLFKSVKDPELRIFLYEREFKIRNQIAEYYIVRAEYLDSRSMDKNLFFGKLLNPLRLYEKATITAKDTYLFVEIQKKAGSYKRILEAREILHQKPAKA